MDRRVSLVDQFSTFIVWTDGRYQRWQTDPQLRRHMEHQLQKDDSLTSSQYWVIYWHQQWQCSGSPTSKALSREHLYSYLQNSCYRIAAQLWTTYRHRDNQTLEDLFSLGILCFQKLLEKFNPILNPNLAAYACSFLKWRMIDELRRLDKSYGHTRWSLLLHSSEARVRKALIAMGLTNTVLACHLQAWECYLEIYKPARIVQGGKVQAPPPEIWAQIAEVYNAIMPQAQDAESIQQWVETCGEAMSLYVSPPIDSLNRNWELEEHPEQIEVIQDDEPDSNDEDNPIDFIAIQNQILEWLKTEWRELDLRTHRFNVHTRTMVQLYYGEGREQTEISQQLGIHQSTVSRTLNKVTAIFADRFLDWSKDNLHIPLQVNDIETINEAVSQWIWSICQAQPTGAVEE